jgi:DNA ligase-4
MVAYSERTHAIDGAPSCLLQVSVRIFSLTIFYPEFWRIRGLIQSTSKSVRRRTPKSQHRPLTPSRADSSSDSETEDLSNSQSREAGYSLKSDGTDEGTRHFLLVFFDILHIEGQNLLDETYQKRRQKLEGVIQVIEGFVRFLSPSELYV